MQKICFKDNRGKGKITLEDMLSMHARHKVREKAEGKVAVGRKKSSQCSQDIRLEKGREKG